MYTVLKSHVAKVWAVLLRAGISCIFVYFVSHTQKRCVLRAQLFYV